MSNQTKRDGRRVEQLCLNRPRTKAEIMARLGLSEPRAQRAIDWAKANRLITRSPFLCCYQGEWTYGYRHVTSEVVDNLHFNICYLLTRTTTQITTLDHVLTTTGPLAAVITPKQRNEFASLRGMLITSQAALAQIEHDLANVS